MNKENPKVIDEIIIELKDKNGNPKKVFSEFKIFRILRQFGIRFPKIPFIVGKWDYKLILD